MKLKNILKSIIIVAVTNGLYSCDSEKDLIIIEGNLPIKTSTLFMVGDAAPCGWNIDSPTSLNASEEDPLVFTWQGSLNSGEIKLCLVSGSWDSPFIRPLTDQSEINDINQYDVPFQMHAGDPDEKWRVTESGTYQLKFDLRNWTMSTTYLGAASLPTVEPIITSTCYIVGDATPNGWDIDNPTLLEKKSDYIFEYEGYLNTGELKACITQGDWGVAFIRPAKNGVTISDMGVEDSNFIYIENPDNKWVVSVPGNYNLSFNLYDWTIKVTFLD